MGKVCVSGAMLQCTMGVAPSTLTVLPRARVNSSSMATATVMDSQPLVNIAPFGMCTSLSNPTVASATAAALGVLTPMPCLPAVVAPWMAGSPTVTVGGMPALTDSSRAMCMYGGNISIVSSGQATVNVP